MPRSSSPSPRSSRPPEAPPFRRSSPSSPHCSPASPSATACSAIPNAKVTVTEFLDLQCPICAEASKQTLPTLINDYVRTGKVKLQARTLHFIGPDSTKAARAAAAAQEQGKLWPFVEAFYAAQGAENSGYVTDGFLREVADAAGLDADKLLDAAKEPASQQGMATADQEAAQSQGRLDAHVHGHPQRQDQRDRLRRARRGRAPQGDRVMSLRAASIAVGLAGLAIAGYLTVVHYAGGEPVCAIAHGCATVQKSNYAQLAGVPVALLGLLGYVAILGALVRDGEHGRTAAAFLSLAGFGFSVWLTYVEVARLDAICIWCVASAICMTLLAGLSAVRLVAAPA